MNMSNREYIIWAPPYTHTSAGISVLHYLCHRLNTAGYTAYITGQRNPLWNEQGITKADLDKKVTEGAIVVYPEIVSGNPYNAQRVVRWVLNTPGKLGGDKVYPPSEAVFVFEKIYLPSIPDNRIFTFTPEIEKNFIDKGYERQGALLWRGKGKDLKASIVPEPFTEITYGNPPTRDELAEWFNRAKILYCFDNVTKIIREARLCGCPVRLYPRGEFTKEELIKLESPYGISWNDNDLVEAQQTVHLVREHQDKFMAKQLEYFTNFIMLTQGDELWTK